MSTTPTNLAADFAACQASITAAAAASANQIAAAAQVATDEAALAASGTALTAANAAAVAAAQQAVTDLTAYINSVNPPQLPAA